jgi:hypothetical protein
MKPWGSITILRLVWDFSSWINEAHLPGKYKTEKLDFKLSNLDHLFMFPLEILLLSCLSATMLTGQFRWSFRYRTTELWNQNGSIVHAKDRVPWYYLHNDLTNKVQFIVTAQGLIIESPLYQYCLCTVYVMYWTKKTSVIEVTHMQCVTNMYTTYIYINS